MNSVGLSADVLYDPDTCAGVDEAGRGPLAGPVVAAAVILGSEFDISGLADSKLLTDGRRREIAEKITCHASCYGVGVVSHAEIDRINILNATMLAMERAVSLLRIPPTRVLVDGNSIPDIAFDTIAIIKGDRFVPCISAASILAKVTRDTHMLEVDRQYPGYGFARHKGYPTKEHLQALHEFGICEVHRQSYAPVRSLLEQKIEKQ